MEAMVSEVKKPPWTTSGTCKARPAHCRMCPYVLSRGVKFDMVPHLYPIKNVYSPESELFLEGVEERFTPPLNRHCPYGETFEDAQKRLVELVLSRLKRGIGDADMALEVFESCGIEVDVNFARTSS